MDIVNTIDQNAARMAIPQGSARCIADAKIQKNGVTLPSRVR